MTIQAALSSLPPPTQRAALREVEARIEGKKAGADEFLSRPHVREELLVRHPLIRVGRAAAREGGGRQGQNRDPSCDGRHP